MKKFIAINCPACGGPLRVDVNSTNVVCDFCNAPTTLHQFNGVYELHLAKALAKTKQALRNEVRILRVQQAIQTLDKRWQEAEAELLKGSPVRIQTDGRETSSSGAIGCGVFVTAFLTIPPAAFALLWRKTPLLSSFCAFIALLALGYGVVSTGNYFKLLVKRQKMYNAYRVRRQRLLQRIKQFAK